MTILAQSISIQSDNLHKLVHEFPPNFLFHGGWQLGINSVIFKSLTNDSSYLPVKFQCNLIQGPIVVKPRGLRNEKVTIFQCVVKRNQVNYHHCIQNENLVWLTVTDPAPELQIILRNALTNEILDPDLFSVSILLNLQRYK